MSGCGYLRARAARHAYAQYQDALAVGDTARARTSLLALVRADEDVPEYWTELGQLQAQMGDYRGAYDAFLHAHELDRSNVPVLAALTQIALLSGDIDLANEHARSLGLVDPNSPVVALVRGFSAYKSGELDKAEAEANGLLAQTPNDPFARVLKAKVLIDENKVPEAIAVLEEQHRAVPQDRAATRALEGIYRGLGDWRNLARIEGDAHRADPRDTATSRKLVEALLRAGELTAAGAASVPLLSEGSPPAVVSDVLDLWSRFAPRGTLVPNANRLAQQVSGERRASFAQYFNRVGDPAAAAALLGQSQLPVNHTNARWNAAFAQALALQGRIPEAKRLFDLVVSREPDQVDALRGRIAIEMRTGAAKQAVIDGQRLVTISPDRGDDRVLLARAYLAAGARNDVRRTLWKAVQELPDDERVLAALRSVLASTGDKEGEQRLNDEIADLRRTQLTKELIG
jgi:tetratricopeptide (TPR) repeat protein